mmetsp:Transcript_26260/g.39155  ORF Transcript_26260/g.39155 Transcript_26260/m.39155 type:complete len:415 (+) Transcript_26260:136-1380(+)
MLKNAALMHMKKKKKKEEPPPPTPAAVDKKEEESVEPNSLIDYSNVEIDESPPPSPPPPAPKEIPLSEMPSVDYGDVVTSPPPKELEATVDMDKQQEKDAGFEINPQQVVSPTSVADPPIVVDFDPFQIDAEQQAKKSVVFLDDDDDSHGEFILHSVSDDGTDDMVYPGKKTEEDIDTPPAGTHKKIGGSNKKEERPSVTVITPERKDRERARSSSSRPRARSSSRHRDVEDDDRRRSSSRGARRNSGGGGGGLFSCGDFDDDISDTFKLITQPLKNFKRCGPNETEAVVKDIKRGTLVKDFQRGTYAIEEYLTERLTEFRENQKRRAEAYERRRMEFENWRREREEARREREGSRRSIGGGGSRGRRSSRRDDEYDRGSSRRSYSASKSYDYPDDESLRRGGSDLVTERRAMV